LKDFDSHDRAWRRPSDIIAGWSGAGDTNRGLLAYTTTGNWWDAVARSGATLLVTRETEHLALAIQTIDGRPDVSFMRIPHPSGIAVDRERGIVHIASTRNPNQIFDFEPATPDLGRLGSGRADVVLMPTGTRFYPGSLYIHDLALVEGRLHANAVGQNSVIRLPSGGDYERVWWPRSVDTDAGPLVWRNHLQLNSIAAGHTIAESYFSASAETPSRRRPGHLNFPVDRRGVIFSGETREPVVRGLTRPHSARLFRGQVWVDDSGYGTVGVCDRGQYDVVARLPGWTRGLCFANDVAFVGTSRVIPRFYRYAPGLDVSSTVCGVHALDPISGHVLGSLTWRSGNQVFGIDWLPATSASSFPYRMPMKAGSERAIFYSYARGAQETRADSHNPSGRP
jgi:uncharacterized protein (TIGR03032 family)